MIHDYWKQRTTRLNAAYRISEQTGREEYEQVKLELRLAGREISNEEYAAGKYGD